MTATEKKNPKNAGNNTKVIVSLILIGIVGAGGAWAWYETQASSQAGDRSVPTFVAQQGPLTISVLESGTIKAKEQLILKSEVEGRAAIIFLIEEGTRVKEGDKLVELDASSMVDARIDQEIKVQNAQAAFISARENFEVVKNQAESDKDLAHLDLHFAKKDLEKYVEGEYPKQLLAAEQDIDLYKEELEVAKTRLDWSAKLVNEEYISQSEFREDELRYKRAQQSVELAQTDANLLKTFTHERQIMQLESDVRQAEMALERTLRKAMADVAEAEASKNAKEAELSRQEDKLAKLERQIGNAIIYAPADGLVIYATTAQRGGFRGGSREPLDEGQEVHERQELIYLPVGDSSVVEVDIHEASLKKLKLGLPAIITVDALPGRRFLGHLDFIAPLPDSQSMWMNPDLKVYNTIINVDDEDPALRSGMSCKVELIVAQYEDAVYVPVQSVVTEAGQTCVYKMENGEPVRHTVEIGLDNNRMIHILDGITAGDVICMEPPLRNASVDNQVASDEETEITTGDSDFQSRIQQRLEEARNQPARSTSQPGAAGKGGPGGMGNMTPQQREEMRKKFENMSDEEKQKLREQRQQRGGGAGGPDRPRSRPGGGRGGQ